MRALELTGPNVIAYAGRFPPSALRPFLGYMGRWFVWATLMPGGPLVWADEGAVPEPIEDEDTLPLTAD